MQRSRRRSGVRDFFIALEKASESGKKTKAKDSD